MNRKQAVACAAGAFALPALLAAAPLRALETERLGAPPEEAIMLGPDDDAKAFAAAGFVLETDGWRGCGDPGSASYVPGQIEQVADLNGDGQPEILISESSSFCFGMVGMGYSLVSRQADGAWKLIASGPGIVTFQQTRGAGNWPDMEVGGPGFCFPVLRWNGSEYLAHRNQYDGKPC